MELEIKKKMKRLTLTIVAICMCFALKAQYNNGIIIETVLKTDTTSIGQKIIYPNFQNYEVTISKITIASGQSTGWHKHTFPVFAYILKGNLTVELENNKTMQFPENSSFAEVLETFHNGINKGKENVVLIAFFLGEKGKPLSVHK
jgi:quercetin dioxygenase-like cupin family protein